MAAGEALEESHRLITFEEDLERGWEEYIDSSEISRASLGLEEDRINYPDINSEELVESDSGNEPRLWTPQEDLLLKDLYTKHTPWNEIEGILERSKDALISRVAQLAFPKRERQSESLLPKAKMSPWLENEDNQIIEAYQARESLSDVANQLGRRLNAVYLRLAKLGVVTVGSIDHMVYSKPFIGERPEKYNHPWTKKDEDELLSAFDKGKSLEELLQITKRTPMGLIQNLYRNGRITDTHLIRMVANIQGESSA